MQPTSQAVQKKTSAQLLLVIGISEEIHQDTILSARSMPHQTLHPPSPSMGDLQDPTSRRYCTMLVPYLRPSVPEIFPEIWAKNIGLFSIVAAGSYLQSSSVPGAMDQVV